MTIPSDNELRAFREELNNIADETIESNVRHLIYGTQDNWKRREAEAYIEAKKHQKETNIKQATLAQIEESNTLQKDANKTARWALGIAILSIVISILTAYFK